MKLVLEVSSLEDGQYLFHRILQAFKGSLEEQKKEVERSFEITHPVHVSTPSVLSSPPISNAAVADHAEGWTGEVRIEPFAPTAFAEVMAKAEKALSETLESSAYSKQQIRQAAEHDPELKRLISGKGRRSAETKAEIQRRTAAYFNGEVIVAEVDAPVGKAFEGVSAEDLQQALNRAVDVAEVERVEDRYTHMTKEQLLEAVSALSDQFKDQLQGLRWFKNALGGKPEDANEDRLRAALRDPEAFLS